MGRDSEGYHHHHHHHGTAVTADPSPTQVTSLKLLTLVVGLPKVHGCGLPTGALKAKCALFGLSELLDSGRFEMGNKTKPF